MNLKSKMTAYEYKPQANANDVDIRCVYVSITARGESGG